MVGISESTVDNTFFPIVVCDLSACNDDIRRLTLVW